MTGSSYHYDKYISILEQRLTPKRFNHSLEVAKEAKRLAEKYGADSERAYLCGLLHDITKNTADNEQLKLFRRFGIILTELEQNTKKLWHAITGAAYIKYELGIDDSEIIDAVRYHTTAKADMSLLAKVLYLADFTSLDRDYEDVDEMRRLVDIGLDEAMRYALSYTITDLTSRGLPIHPDTVAAYNQVFLTRK